MSTSELSDALNPHFFDQQLRSDMDAGLWSTAPNVEYGQQDAFAPTHSFNMHEAPAQGNYGHPAIVPARRQRHSEDNGMGYGTPIHPNYPPMPMHPPSPSYPPPQHNNGNFPTRMPYDHPPSQNYLLSPADSQRFSPPRPATVNAGPMYGSNQSLPRSLPPTQANTPISGDPPGMSFNNHPPRPSRSSSWDPSVLPPATANAALLAPPVPQQQQQQEIQMHQRPPRPQVQVNQHGHNMQFQPHRGPPIAGPRLNGNSIPNVSQGLVQRRSSPVAQIASSRQCPPPPHGDHRGGQEWYQAFKQENARRHAWEQEHERKQSLLQAQVAELKGMLLHQQSQGLNTQQMTPSPSPSVSTGAAGAEPAPRKRRRMENGLEPIDVDDDGVKQEPDVKKRRRSVRCLTLAQAMKAHILHLMSVEDEDALPSPPASPSTSGSLVRFDWDKTLKQSSFNATMKNRVLSSLKDEYSTLYPEVPKKEFSQRGMDRTFDEVFGGFRQKWKETRHGKGEQPASRGPRRGRSASGSGIKKIKLERRIQARGRSSKWSDKMFDGCFQVECMSDEEEDEDGETVVKRIVPWRSSRLTRLFDSLDGNGSSSPRRIPDGEEQTFALPPSDISRWMVSKRWVAHWKDRKTGLDLHSALETLYADEDDEDEDLNHLGSDSESDLSELDEPQQQTTDSVADF